jgi:D-alanyl-D-alanine carboxypeptidase
MTKLRVGVAGVLGLGLVMAVAAQPVWAQGPVVEAGAALPATTTSQIDAAAAEVLKTTGVPSASVAVVAGGKIAYVKAYGEARLEPPMAAEPEMQYSIGSISKQFTAAMVLFLVQDGKLKLDDRVGSICRS